ncbi:MAG: DUF6298 domain-containing protein [Lentisphaeria bacterium]
MVFSSDETVADPPCLETSNGWYVQDGNVIWGYAQLNQIWGGFRGKPAGWWTDVPVNTCIIRNAPGQFGPNLTEDLEALTDSMLAYGCPGYVHTPPLWYDRRRDTHDLVRRGDANGVGPFLEMPWARSNQGQAWDGLPLYDLTQFNPWHFARLKQFADLCDRKGCLLFFHFYNQHNLLETQAHYSDFPWRPANCLQATDLPDTTPAADAFYDVSHPLRRQLHQRYIWHCLDALQGNRNVVFLTGFEYTGPLSFMQFWLDTILEWERRTGRKRHLGLGATRDVADAVLQDERHGPRIGTIDLQRWFYNRSDDSLNAPPGGRQIPGRYMEKAREMTPRQLYRQVREYRQRYPDKALIHAGANDQQQTMAFLLAGGSMLVQWLRYAQAYPREYGVPVGSERILPVYDFIRHHLAADLPRMQPLDMLHSQEPIWCLGERGQSYLIYMPTGNQEFSVDLADAPGTFDAKWIGLELGTVFDSPAGPIPGGQSHHLCGLDQRSWLLWLRKQA